MTIRDMEHTLTVKTSQLVFIARLIQIIFGGASMIMGIVLMAIYGNTWYYWHDTVYYETGVENAFVFPLVILSCLTVMVGAIGMFAHKRPNDIHWHLMLTLDWFTLLTSLANIALCIIVALVSVPALAYALAAIVTTCSLASLVPVIRTHRLKKRGLLPPRNSTKESWYYMEDNNTPAAQTNFNRQPSQATTRAPTTTRWSGLSGAETEVPPYSGAMSPVAEAVYPKH